MPSARSDDPVGLYGHSQGGIVVTRLAGDPGVAEHYNITTLTTDRKSVV